MANEFVIRRGLISLGGVRTPLTTVNDANYSISAATDYYVEVTASSAQRTATLPTPAEGQTFVIKNKYSSTEKVVVATVGSETLDGQNTVTLSPGEVLQVTTDGSNWIILNETGNSLGAGCYETDLASISTGGFPQPNSGEITVWNLVNDAFLVSVDKTQNGIDIESLLLSFEENAGLITITDSSDNFCSFTPATISTGATYVNFTQFNSVVTGTLPENMDLGSAVICFTPASNGTSGSSGSSGTSGSSGSSGTSGSSGSSGTSGSSGSSGTSGSSGSSGTSGSSGSSGTSGSSGSSGTSGSSGSSGTSGSSGSSGTSGSSGSSGTSGSSGSSGTSGSSGSSGTSGSSGSSGTSGSSGSSGTSGSSGSSGTSGSSGSSGTSGSSGSSGTSGSSGSSGTSGSSGSSGTSGSSGSSGSSGTSGSSGSSGTSGSSGSSGSSGTSGVTIVPANCTGEWTHKNDQQPEDNGELSLYDNTNGSTTNFANVKTLNISDDDAQGNNITLWFTSISAGDNIRVNNVVDPDTNFGIYEVDSITNNSTYYTLSLTVLASDGSLTINGRAYVCHINSGTSGSSGSSGSSGTSGSSGSSGTSGSSGSSGTSGSSGSSGTSGSSGSSGSSGTSGSSGSSGTSGSSGSSGTSGSSGSSGTSGVINCYNFENTNVNGVPGSGKFVAFNSTSSNFTNPNEPPTFIYFSTDAYVGDDLIPNLGDNIFNPIAGGGGTITFMDMENPNNIVIYEYNELNTVGSFWYMNQLAFSSTNPTYISAGFTSWNNGGNYCVYINSDL